MLYDFRKKIQGIVITSCCRVEERKIIVACIYFAWRCDVVKKKKRYRLLCMLLSERKVGDWLSIFCVRMARKNRQAGIDKRLDTIACLFFYEGARINRQAGAERRKEER